MVYSEIHNDCKKVPCCGKCKNAFYAKMHRTCVGSHSKTSGRIVGIDLPSVASGVSTFSVTTGIPGVWFDFEQNVNDDVTEARE